MNIRILCLFFLFFGFVWGFGKEKNRQKINTEIVVRKSLIERYNDSIVKIESDIKINNSSIALINSQLSKLGTFYLNQENSHKKILQQKTKEWIAQQNSFKKGLMNANRELEKIVAQIKQMKEVEILKIKKNSQMIETELVKIKPILKPPTAKETNLYSFVVDKRCRINRKSRGFDFTCPKNQILKAVKEGTISHFGTLANLGNILVIDHVDHLRSVFLGEIETSLHNHESIKKFQKIGLTESGHYYFELRKNSTTITNINWIKE